jgi:hypothetical protein
MLFSRMLDSFCRDLCVLPERALSRGTCTILPATGDVPVKSQFMKVPADKVGGCWYNLATNRFDMLPAPTRFLDKIKLHAWRWFLTPAFPYVRDSLLALGIVHHDKRQPWRIGWLAPDNTLEDLLKYLENIGFRNHFVAWVDSEEAFSLRRPDGFTYQYHLRIFRDGEVRGHYEKTPESNPVQHFRERIFEPRTEKFQEWLRGWISSRPPAVSADIMPHSMPATSLDSPNSG